ncbi:MAG: hypothetical protein ACRYG4_27665, partial [Janthinobacterium lividum]
NRFEEMILLSLDSMASERKLIGRWKGALRRANEELRKTTAEAIYNMIPRDTPERENVARFVRDTTSRMLSVDEMTDAIGSLRDRLNMPVGLILHNFQFMPDGRSVGWPAEFKDESAEVARRLNVPTLDIATFVQSEGVKVLADDLRHWSPNYFAPIGEMIEDFGASILKGQKSGALPKAAPQLKPVEPAIEVVRPVNLFVGDLPYAGPETSDEDDAGSVPRTYSFDPLTGRHLAEAEDTIFTVIVLGGAWANGANNDPADSAVSTEPGHPGHALMFDSGLRPRGRQPQFFVDLRERAGGSAKETPCSGIADQVIRNCKERFGRAPRMLFFSLSRGGTSLSGRGMTSGDGFLRGTEQHSEVLRLVARAQEIAADTGQRLEVAAICLLHGESEVSRSPSESAYRQELALLQRQYDADLRALTKQAEPVRLYLTQTNRVPLRSELEVQRAQLNAGSDNPYVQCVGPTYFAPPEVRDEGGAAYVKALGYRRIGQIFGRFLLDDLWGPRRDPLRIENARWVGPKTIRVRYNRAVVIEDGDALVNVSRLGAGRGIEFNDGTSWSPDVETVRMVRGRDSDLDIELTAPSHGYAKRLLVAARPTADGEVGRLHGARSAIRSKDAFDVDPLDGTELFDWACTEVVQLA